VQVIGHSGGGHSGGLESGVLEVEGGMSGAAVLDVQRRIFSHVPAGNGAFKTARLGRDGAGVRAAVGHL